MGWKTCIKRAFLAPLAAAGILFLSAAPLGGKPAMAAESIVIPSLSVAFKSTYGEAEILEPEITTKVTGAELSEVIWSKDIDKWSPGKKVRVSLVFKSTDKIFADSYNRTECKVTGAKYVSAKAEDNETLVVKVDYQPVVTLGFTARAGWDSQNKTTAVWEKVEFATGYQLNLYGDDKKKAKVTVSTNSADLSSYLNDADATYYYEVRAVGYTAEDKKYRKEGAYVTSDDVYFDNLGDVEGTWKNEQYKQEDGEYAVNDWKLIRGKWYYFDGSGKRMAGWANVNGQWYYLGSDGAMVTGWRNLDGKWYYLNEETGAMAIGWNELAPGTWYYFNMDGSMAVNTWIGQYWVDWNGIWIH